MALTKCQGSSAQVIRMEWGLLDLFCRIAFYIALSRLPKRRKPQTDRFIFNNSTIAIHDATGF